VNNDNKLNLNNIKQLKNY